MPYSYIVKNRPYPDGTCDYHLGKAYDNFTEADETANFMAKISYRGSMDSFVDSYIVLELHMSKEAYKQWRKENGIGTNCSKKVIDLFLSKNNEALAEQKMQAEQASLLEQKREEEPTPVLTEEMLQSFLASLAPNDAKGYAWNSAAKLLTKRYLGYLNTLDDPSKTKSHSLLLIQLKDLKEKNSQFIPFIEEIYKDLKSEGRGHKSLVKDADLIERLEKTTEQSLSSASQIPKQIHRTGVNFWERNVVRTGRLPEKKFEPEGVMNIAGRKEERELNVNENNTLQQLQSKGLNKAMLINLETVGEFSTFHEAALIKLVNKGSTIIEALTEIDGFSAEQAEGITVGLKRDQIHQLKTRWEGKALVELRDHGLTVKMLRSRNSGEHSFDESHFVALKLLASSMPIKDALGKLDNLSSDEAETLYREYQPPTP